jgi:[acyl-carrier-protein] S-malonyltransferase
MKSVFVFPGQGSHSVGMLGKFATDSSIVANTFAEGSEALGFDIGKLIAEGPAERLNETINQQPAMLAAGIATWRLCIDAGGKRPDAVCGHSLGEFSALVAADSLPFAAAIKLVRRRAELMQEAVPVGEGAIAAVLGLDDAAIVEVCKEVAQGQVVEPVNYNSPGQIVIAGHAAAVDRAIALSKTRGAKRAVLLPMSVPAHSSLMQPAAKRFGEILLATSFAKPQIAFWSPVDCTAHNEPADLVALLGRQLNSPVRWSDLILRLINEGATRFVECGPGKILTSLNRRIDKNPAIHCQALQEPESLKEYAS